MMRRAGVLPIAAVALSSALAAACESPTVPARTIAYDFVFEGFGERLIYRWPTGSTIGVYVVPGSDAATTAELEAAFDHMAAAWNDAVLFAEYRLVRTAVEDADVVLAWANTTLPIDTDECRPVAIGAAWTTFCLDDGVTPQDVAAADRPIEGIYAYPLVEGEHNRDGVHMIVQVLDNPTTDGRVAALVTHEFGHVLGIGTHPCRLDEAGCTRRDGAHESVMYGGLPERDTPSAADRSTIEVLYHTRPHLIP